MKKYKHYMWGGLVGLALYSFYGFAKSGSETRDSIISSCVETELIVFVKSVPRTVYDCSKYQGWYAKP